MSNSKLNKAKKEKNDEFYTQYVDIEKELQHYNIEGKTIYCNCDNPHYSNFYKYFKDKFNIHKIKHLYCTGYNKDGNGYYAEYNGTEETIKTLNGNGSFDSDECKQIMQECDIVITNPPFSLFRDYVAQLMEYGKKFLIIGNQNAITYKEIFPYIKNDELWLGATGIKDMSFKVPSSYGARETRFWIDENGQHWRSLGNGCWYTNMPHIKQNKPLILTKTYNPIYYPRYDNYDAINVDKVKDIPMDYDGVMGVPITFLQYYNPSQFEIVAQMANTNVDEYNFGYPFVFGKKKYARILIKKNNSLEPIKFEIVDARDYTNIDKLKSKSTFLVKDKDSAINGKPTYARILIKRI